MTEPTAAPKLPMSYTELAELEPKAAVLLMFNHLEGLLKRSFGHEYPDEKLPGTMAVLAAILLEKGVIDAGLKTTLDKLRVQRNDVVHNDPQVSRQEANDYFEILGDALVALTRTSLYN